MTNENRRIRVELEKSKLMEETISQEGSYTDSRPLNINSLRKEVRKLKESGSKPSLSSAKDTP
jgi:hypothetical protein